MLNRRSLLTKGLIVSSLTVGTQSLASPAVAKSVQRLTMVTSWPRSSPGPGTTADRIAQSIASLSQGQMDVQLYGASELVPAFNVFDAVSNGTADLGHSASFFQAGKHKAATIFTTLPFGMKPLAHQSWVEQGGGQALWDQIYADFAVKPFLAGNSDMTMGGWFKTPVTDASSLKGRKLRIAGLGALIYQALGASTITLAPQEIFAALSGASLDGLEFLGPFSDQAAGYARLCPYYYYPGFNKPNGSAEGLVNAQLFNRLNSEQRAIIETAFTLENHRGLAEANWFNAQALAQLKQGGTQVERFQSSLIKQAYLAWQDVRQTWLDQNPEVRAVYDSYAAASELLGDWRALEMQDADYS